VFAQDDRGAITRRIPCRAQFLVEPVLLIDEVSISARRSALSLRSPAAPIWRTIRPSTTSTGQRQGTRGQRDGV
jgi:hypothetical protein